jgi:hypothetical protein
VFTKTRMYGKGSRILLAQSRCRDDSRLDSLGADRPPMNGFLMQMSLRERLGMRTRRKGLDSSLPSEDKI